MSSSLVFEALRLTQEQQRKQQSAALPVGQSTLRKKGALSQLERRKALLKRADSAAGATTSTYARNVAFLQGQASGSKRVPSLLKKLAERKLAERR